MRYRVLGFAAAVTVIATMAASAQADETWTSAVGIIEWETEVGGTAVFRFATPGTKNATTRIFVEGLVADVGGGRGSYSGYWTDDSNRKVCDAELIDPLGTRTRRWGRFEITFVRDEFPSNWNGRYGDCFNNPTKTLNAVAQ